MVCICKDWTENIELVTGPLLMVAIRYNTGGYTGVKFRYCPWCGQALQEEIKK